MYLRLGPDEKVLTDVPDDQKIQKDYPDTRRTQKDVPDDQKMLEIRKTTETYQIHARSRLNTY